jgi:hypothetical protein
MPTRLAGAAAIALRENEIHRACQNIQRGADA